MQIITADFETFFSDQFTLKKMTTEAYVRDARFSAHGCAIKIGRNRPTWIEGDALKAFAGTIDWTQTALLCHHAQFDGLIFNHHYGVRPAMWFDTLSMARMLIRNDTSVSLDSVRAHFGLPVKRTPYHLFKGKQWHELSEWERREVADGACDEVESIYKIFIELAKTFPREEYEVVDTTIRMFTEPTLMGDLPLLAEVWTEEENNKTSRLAALDVGEDDLQSPGRFQALLEAEGVEVAYKQGKNGPIPAFAKTDQFMRDLLEDENDRVRTLVEARLGIKSTQLQTRAETLGHMANRGPLCIYLKFCAAHTTRWGGGDGSNFQNLKRRHKIRKALRAPKGHILAIVDSSQIECRLLNTIAGQNDVVENFANGKDPYTGIASQFYNRNITKADVSERGTGKQAELSCGFGCGPPKFQATARLGIYGPPVYLDIEAASRFVGIYRGTHQFVTDMWRHAGNLLPWINGGLQTEWGPFRIQDQCLWLPNGAPIIYETLHWHVDEETGEAGWRLKTRAGYQKMYGAKLVENAIQGLARVFISQIKIRVRQAGLRTVMSSHDELVVLLPRDGTEEKKFEWLLTIMRQSPQWLPNCPMDAEGILSERYEK